MSAGQDAMHLELSDVAGQSAQRRSHFENTLASS